MAHLACQEDGKPYVLPLNYAYDGEAVYVHALAGWKIDIMRRQPLVCVQVDQVEHAASWKSAVAWGRYEELAGEATRRALRILVERLAPPNPDRRPDPFAPPGLEDRVVMFRVCLRERTGRYVSP